MSNIPCRVTSDLNRYQDGLYDCECEENATELCLPCQMANNPEDFFDEE